MFAKKVVQKKKKLYIFEKPLTMPFRICKMLYKILYNLLFLRKTKYVQISFDGICANNLQNFLYKTCAIRFLMSQAFQKAKN